MFSEGNRLSGFIKRVIRVIIQGRYIIIRHRLNMHSTFVESNLINVLLIQYQGEGGTQSPAKESMGVLLLDHNVTVVYTNCLVSCFSVH